MRITDIRKQMTDDGVRLAARFLWEDVDRPPEEVAFEVPRMLFNVFA